MSPIARRGSAALSLLCAALLIAACAPEATETPLPTPEPTAAPTAEAGAAAAGAAASPAFCSAYVVVTKAFMDSSITGGAEGTAQMDKAAIVAEAQKLADSMTAITASAPAELQKSLGIVNTAIDKIVQTGDTTGFMDEDMMTETADVDLWAYDHCGWAQVPVTAVDYAFEGIPATLPAGMTAFKLDNTAKEEMHVMLVVRRKPGSTATTKDLMEYKGEGFHPDFELLAATGANAGKSGVAVADLTSGAYVILCPIPQGGKPDGKSHAELGMVSEFTVP